METPKPTSDQTPDHYEVPVVMTPALEQAETDARHFAGEVSATHSIEVDQVPSTEQDVPVHQRTDMGKVALGDQSDRRIRIGPDKVTPQMMRNAIGSPFRQDEAERIVPRNDGPEA